MPLLILNENPTGPSDYADRKVVKAVIIDDKGYTAHFSTGLVGGGVEEGETDEIALHREVMEETGMKVQILKPLGEIIGYRDALKKKYVIHGYLCKYVDKISTPTTLDEDEIKMKLVWEKSEEAIKHFESGIISLKATDRNLYEEGDLYQSKLFGRQSAVAFLNS